MRLMSGLNRHTSTISKWSDTVRSKGLHWRSMRSNASGRIADMGNTQSQKVETQTGRWNRREEMNQIERWENDNDNITGLDIDSA